MRPPRADSARRKEQTRNHLSAALLALALCGCGGAKPPPSCSGPVWALNPDRWQASPNDLVEPPRRAAALGCPQAVVAGMPALGDRS